MLEGGPPVLPALSHSLGLVVLKFPFKGDSPRTETEGSAPPLCKERNKAGSLPLAVFDTLQENPSVFCLDRESK
jgi:hypothetical protein